MTGNGQEMLWNAYLLYLKDWVNDHKEVDNFGDSPLGFVEWQKDNVAEPNEGDDYFDLDMGMED